MHDHDDNDIEGKNVFFDGNSMAFYSPMFLSQILLYTWLYLKIQQCIWFMIESETTFFLIEEYFFLLYSKSGKYIALQHRIATI